MAVGKCPFARQSQRRKLWSFDFVILPNIFKALNNCSANKEILIPKHMLYL